MKKEWILTQGSFDALLDWLDADRERAAERYEGIRLRLIKIFAGRGCAEAEELADETINRVTEKVGQIASNYSGDPARYFYGVSRNVYLEYLRRARSASEIQFELENAARLVAEPRDCLEKCLDVLTPEQRDLVFQYYQSPKGPTIDFRTQLATERGISINSLRIQAHRVRLVLHQCIQNCLREHSS